MSSVHLGSGDTIEVHHTLNLISVRIAERPCHYNLPSELPLSAHVTETGTCEELE